MRVIFSDPGLGFAGTLGVLLRDWKIGADLKTASAHGPGSWFMLAPAAWEPAHFGGSGLEANWRGNELPGLEAMPALPPKGWWGGGHPAHKHQGVSRTKCGRSQRGAIINQGIVGPFKT